MTKNAPIHENPFAVVSSNEHIPFNQLMVYLFCNVRPLDNSESLQLAIHNIKLAINGCQHWKRVNFDSDGMARADASYEMLQTFHMEENCLQLLEAIYTNRLLLAEEEEKNKAQGNEHSMPLSPQPNLVQQDQEHKPQE